MSNATFPKYGLNWPAGTDSLALEFKMIRMNYGKADAVKHYLAAHKLIWPEDDQHRWFVLGITRICENKITVFLGPASSNKTYIFAVHALIDFWVFNQTSFSLISSTEKRSLEIKVWGRVKGLFNRGKMRHDWLGGFILESQMAITPDDIDDDNEMARELNRGIVCVPCVSGGRFVGMGKFQGAKPPHSPGKNDGILKHYGDEAAVMQPSFLDAYSNWMVSAGFKGTMGGNPTDISDPLCVAAEPEGGWDTFVDTKKTQEWTSRWYGAHVIAFDGRDTPNNDDPKNRFPYLISQAFIDLMKATHGEDSWQFFQQAVGKPSMGMVSNRVITIAMCEANHAFDLGIWQDGKFEDIYAIDPAYGGGDRCVAGRVRMGTLLNGQRAIKAEPPRIIPIILNSGKEPEDQIAEFVFKETQKMEIPAENIFYDSFGRGTLGNHFVRQFGAACPIPVDSGARPTQRPVRFNLFIQDKDGRKRLKRCDEEYSKFVTEMWFSTREAIRMGQVRELPKNVAYEGQLRMFEIVSGNRTEVEPKDEMKKRCGKSPDLYDWFAIAVEGCRQRGFKIQNLENHVEPTRNVMMEWFLAQQKISAETRRRGELRATR
jgi:hypothetical protein